METAKRTLSDKKKITKSEKFNVFDMFLGKLKVRRKKVVKTNLTWSNEVWDHHLIKFQTFIIENNTLCVDRTFWNEWAKCKSLNRIVELRLKWDEWDGIFQTSQNLEKSKPFELSGILKMKIDNFENLFFGISKMYILFQKCNVVCVLQEEERSAILWFTFKISSFISLSTWVFHTDISTAIATRIMKKYVLVESRLNVFRLWIIFQSDNL